MYHGVPYFLMLLYHRGNILSFRNLTSNAHLYSELVVRHWAGCVVLPITKYKLHCCLPLPLWSLNKAPQVKGPGVEGHQSEQMVTAKKTCTVCCRTTHRGLITCKCLKGFWTFLSFYHSFHFTMAETCF